jgi:hypothetical protein
MITSTLILVLTIAPTNLAHQAHQDQKDLQDLQDLQAIKDLQDNLEWEQRDHKDLQDHLGQQEFVLANAVVF